MQINDTVRWNDPNGSPLTGIVVAINDGIATVATPYNQALEVAVERLTKMTQNRLVETASGMKWE